MPEEKAQSKADNPFLGRKYIRALGRRKSASAVVQLYAKGRGKMVVNKVQVLDYFGRNDLVAIAKNPLVTSSKAESVDINARVTGGGKHGQAEAVKLAIARALVSLDEGFKPALRKGGMLTVDRRVKERKKPGLKRARRAPQWSKR
jgi:small subunit ribosomal protein S9